MLESHRTGTHIEEAGWAMAGKKMRTKPFTVLTSTALAAAALTLFSPVVLGGDDESDARVSVVPQYLRDSGRRPEIVETPEPEDPPSDLRLEAQVFSVVSPSRLRAGGRGPSQDPVDDERDRQIAERAAAAADWTAHEIASTRGWRQYYRVGFHRGMGVALDDDLIGGPDYMAGVRTGRRDPGALLMGADLGRRAAQDAAETAAATQVADQFYDLYHEPRRDPRAVLPHYEVREHWATGPELSEVFAAYSVYRVARIENRVRKAFGDWEWDAWRLYETPRHQEFFDGSWRDPEDAFRYWKDHRRRSAFYHGTRDRDDRDYFRAVFQAEFARLVHVYYGRHLRRGYREGFEDGWTYGAFVNREWHYRQGYNEGFDEGVASAAFTSYQVTYALVYERYYDDIFDEWSHNPKPGIAAIHLVDGNDDGVFQPGEEIFADYELVNYGGRDGTFVARFEGPEIELAQEVTVRLPARSVTRSGAPVQLSIDPHVPARTGTRVDLLLADLRSSVDLMVSYPLEFPREVDLDRDSLAGRAVVRVLVVNTSRKPVDALVALERVDGYPFHLEQDLGTLPAGAQRWVAFELADLRPLDMISGDLRAHFAVRSPSEIQDRMEFRFPDAVSDLYNRELLELMVILSRSSGVPRSDIAEARALMLRRLRVDWTAAVRSRGNPYKKDYKSRGTRTALGDLVQTYSRERSGISNEAVFEGLDAEIEALAEELPGVHPFLRKYMKRLARKLG
jgi:hypothetical protein